MATLTNTKIKDTYDGLLKTTDNEALDVSGVTLIEDGLGNASALSVGRSGNGVSVSGNLAVDTNTLYVDAANNRVGVGTSTPYAAIQAVGTIKVATGNAQGILALGDGAGTTVNAGIWRGAANNPTSDGNYLNLGGYDGIVLATGNAAIGSQTERMRIDSSGNVGINCSPVTKLDVTGDIHSTVGLRIGSATNGTTGQFLTDGTNTYLDYNGFLSVRRSSSSAESVRIDSSGRVGIGTSSPAAVLEVNNDTDGETVAIFEGRYAAVSDVTLASFQRNGGAVAAAVKYADASTAIEFGTTTGHSLILTTGDTERMRITSAGNVGIGNVGSNAKLEVSASSGEIFRADASGGAYRIVANQSGVNLNGNVGIGDAASTGVGRVNISANPSNNYQIEFFTSAGTSVGSITTSGGTTTNYNTSSDYRLKEDLQPIATPLDRVDLLNPVNFAWKTDGSRVDGFIAHELQEVIPEAVTGEKDAVDEEGNPIYQGIDQSKIVPLLVGAIKELRAEIELLKSQLNA